MRRQWNYCVAMGLAALAVAPLQTIAQSGRPVTAVATQLLAGGGTRYAVEPTTSLAWWQMNPNYGHLWATTCPGDPAWSAGEGHGNGFAIKEVVKKTRVSAYMDYRIPLYPRLEVAPVCRRAIKGEITLRNPNDIASARGVVEVLADSLETGSSMRNSFQRKSIFGTYNRITFTLDSIGDFEQAGDTLKAVAKGSWQMHGVTKPLFFPVVLVKEANGLRVQGKTATFPRMLLEEYKMSKFALGAGVGMNLWKELHFGFDLIFKPAPGSAP